MLGTVLEICVDSSAGLKAARAGGADRVELCSALVLGGLTPGPGLVAAAQKTGIPFAAMARPRPGGFVLGPGDLDATLRDIEVLAHAGACAVVCGALTPAGHLDQHALGKMVAAAGTCPVVLHRAIDLVEDWRAALEVAIDAKVTRILTSGGCSTAPQGAQRIATMVQASAGRIEIMAGGGIGPDIIEQMLSLGVDSVHGSASRPSPAHGAEPIGVPPYAQTCPTKVAAMRAAIDRWGAAA